VLGSGDIALILDVQGLVGMANQQQAATTYNEPELPIRQLQ
jgi:hypothetical protein